jgi:hypothetical protein
LYFQPKRHAREQKEAGLTTGSLRIEERRERAKNLKDSASRTPTWRKDTNMREHQMPCHTRVLSELLVESVTGLDE